MKMSISCLPAQMGEVLTSKVSLLQALILRAWPSLLIKHSELGVGYFRVIVSVSAGI